MSKRPRRSRAKPWTAADIDRIELEIAQVTDDPETGNIYAADVRPEVDREALLRAVSYPHFDALLAMEGKRRGMMISDEWRWRRLCRIRVAMRELVAMAQELKGAVPKANANDPRNLKPVSKLTLWRMVHPGEPRNTAEVSRWYASKVEPVVDPVKVSRSAVTLNLRLFSERFGLDIGAVSRALP